MRRHLQILILPLLTASAACEGKTPFPAADPAAASAPAPSSEPASAIEPSERPLAKRKARAKTVARWSFEAELAQVEIERAGLEALLEKTPSNLLNRERIAASFMRRARLSGSYDDYAKAQAALQAAFDLEPLGSTYALRAKLHYTLHRLPLAREDYHKARPITRPTPDAIASLEAFEANLALQAGDDETAREHFAASLAAKRNTSNLGSAAVFHWKTGDFEQAEALFLEALKTYHGTSMEPRAWIHLNLGLLDLDRGRYDDALAHYREAESFLQGYWLIEEHIAEVLTLQGKSEEAKTLYLGIIDRTNNPEFMDAMAGISFAQGKAREGKAWVERARTRYEEQMSRYPEAAYGHALGHYLEFGEDPAYTLELAQKNYDLRPNLDASVMLAQAHLEAGDPKAAAKALEPILETQFKSAELYVTAAEVQSKLGKHDRSRAFLKKARAIDPTASL